jgi:hypothetical protein
MMVKAKNPRQIVNAGVLIGRALSPKELMAVAAAVKVAKNTADDDEDFKTLTLAFAKLRAAEKWKALDAKNRS